MNAYLYLKLGKSPVTLQYIKKRQQYEGRIKNMRLELIPPDNSSRGWRARLAYWYVGGILWWGTQPQGSPQEAMDAVWWSVLLFHDHLKLEVKMHRKEDEPQHQSRSDHRRP